MKTKTSMEHASKNVVGMFLVFGACVVIAILAIYCWLWTMTDTLVRKPVVAPVVTSTPAVTTTEPVVDDYRKAPYYTEKNVYGYTGYEFDQLDFEIRNTLVRAEFLKREAVDVDWQAPTVVPTSTLSALFNQTPGEYQLPLTQGPYLRGTVKTGTHAGWEIYSYTVQDEGGLGGPYDIVSMVLRSPDGAILQVSVGEDYSTAGGIAGSDERLKLEDPLPRLVLTNGKVLTLAHTYSIQTSQCWVTGCAGSKKMATTKEGVNVFQAVPPFSSTYRVFMKDGRSFAYNLLLPGGVTTTQEQGAQIDPVYTSKVFRWNSGYQNQDSFVEFYRGGCGFVATSSIMSSNSVRTRDLIEIGKTISGETLYGVKNYKTHPLTAVAYDNWFSYDEDGEKRDLDGFLKEHPVPYFFYRNALGELVRYVLGDGVYMGECGKPVIYLYPPKTTPVSVKLGSNINVTVSEPTYPRHGWNVVAQPDGQLSYEGKTYGSLFWEGTGVGYDVPKTGFILKDGQVDEQLKTILAKYGLNEKESAEFREFWVPKMTGAAYYRVSFVETAAWNKAAPLSVSPRPTSVLRIFMDWQKLSKPVELTEPTIQPFAREGFTLVEWGGLLRK